MQFSGKTIQCAYVSISLNKNTSYASEIKKKKRYL